MHDNTMFLAEFPKLLKGSPSTIPRIGRTLSLKRRSYITMPRPRKGTPSTTLTPSSQTSHTSSYMTCRIFGSTNVGSYILLDGSVNITRSQMSNFKNPFGWAYPNTFIIVLKHACSKFIQLFHWCHLSPLSSSSMLPSIVMEKYSSEPRFEPQMPQTEHSIPFNVQLGPWLEPLFHSVFGHQWNLLNTSKLCLSRTNGWCPSPFCPTECQWAVKKKSYLTIFLSWGGCRHQE